MPGLLSHFPPSLQGPSQFSSQLRGRPALGWSRRGCWLGVWLLQLRADACCGDKGAAAGFFLLGAVTAGFLFSLDSLHRTSAAAPQRLGQLL